MSIRIENYSRRAILSGGAAIGIPALIKNYREAGEFVGEKDIGILASALPNCERMLDLALMPEERVQLLATIDEQLDAIRTIHGMDFDNSQVPALRFDPRLPGRVYREETGGVSIGSLKVQSAPVEKSDVAFAPISSQAYWLQTRQLSSLELTEIYLGRIRRYDPFLFGYITVVEELALDQADRADEEIANGVVRGPLHGIPYAVKDLIDTEAIRTTWGATPYRDRVPRSNAWVIDRLAAVGAVLIGKTASGALARGDQWFGGRTRNPWNPNEGSSGSSAGSASATAAGLCGFSLGTETGGSIVTPASRCGTVGLRPTFGRVPRTGTMALCWSLDKIGPLCRSTSDAALVLDAINGWDPKDPSSLSHSFSWDSATGVEGMRVGYIPEWFEMAAEADQRVLGILRDLGVELVEISLPDWPYETLYKALEIEAAAAFLELTLSNRDDELVWQGNGAWPNTWRQAHFFSAVDYVQINRFRRKVMCMMDEMMSGLDAIISPNYDDILLSITTFTGQPCLTIRAGFTKRATRQPIEELASPDPDAPRYSVPENIMLWGPLFEERKLLTLGSALENVLDVSDVYPPLEHWRQHFQ